MLDLPSGRRGRLLALGLTLCVAGAVWFAVVGPLLAWHSRQGEVLAEKMRMLAHMQSLAASVPELKRQASQLAGQALAQEDLLAGSTDALAGAALEERLQALAGASNVPVGSEEILSAADAGPLRRIG